MVHAVRCVLCSVVFMFYSFLLYKMFCVSIDERCAMCAAGVLRSMLSVTAGSRPSAAAFSASSFFQVQMHVQMRGTYAQHVHAVQYVVQFVRSQAIRNAALLLNSFGF